MQSLIIRDHKTWVRAKHVIDGLEPGKPMELILKPYKKGRSLSQNGLMWKWINKAAEVLGNDLGYDAEDMHEIFKAKFLPASGRKLIEIDGEPYERLSTKRLNTKEMSEYMNAIDRFCASFGCVLPHPEDMQRNH